MGTTIAIDDSMLSRRVVARLIDYSIVWIAVAFISMFFGVFVSAVAAMVSVPFDAISPLGQPVVVYVLTLGYFALQESRSGTTIGKRIRGVRVFSDIGATPSFAQAIKRNALFSVWPPVFGILELLSMQSSPDGRRLGDRWAGTHVALAEGATGLAPAPKAPATAGIESAVAGLWTSIASDAKSRVQAAEAAPTVTAVTSADTEGLFGQAATGVAPKNTMSCPYCLARIPKTATRCPACSHEVMPLEGPTPW